MSRPPPRATLWEVRSLLGFHTTPVSLSLVENGVRWHRLWSPFQSPRTVPLNIHRVDRSPSFRSSKGPRLPHSGVVVASETKASISATTAGAMWRRRRRRGRCGVGDGDDAVGQIPFTTQCGRCQTRSRRWRMGGCVEARRGKGGVFNLRPSSDASIFGRWVPGCPLPGLRDYKVKKRRRWGPSALRGSIQRPLVESRQEVRGRQR